MKVAIIGGGITGLTAGYCLAEKGHQVTVFEKSKFLGGLAGSFKEKGWQWPVEGFFHHLFTSDREIISFANKLGIGNKLFLATPITSIFKAGKISQFDSTLSVLKSPLLPLAPKLRTGFVTAYLRYISRWQNLEGLTAENWLKMAYGPKTYQVLWEPLFRAKFSQKAPEISMAWFWSRIRKRTQRLAYFEGGFQTLIDILAEKIRKNKGQIILSAQIKHLNDIPHYRNFDRTIVTTPPEIFLKIAPELAQGYKKEIGQLETIGAIVLALILKEKFLTDNTYWLNINEPGFPFAAVVEHTNLIDSGYYGGNHLLYVGSYYPQNHRYFTTSKEEIFQEFLPYLKRINPGFKFKNSLPGQANSKVKIFKSLFAQPIIPINYSKIKPSLKTPISGLYWASMHHIYPWDRGTNYAVDLGIKVANEILKK